MDIKKYKLSKSQRLFFLISSIYQFIGFWLSDFDIHWMLYIPAVMFLGASLNGYCSMMIITKKILKEDNNNCCK
jgi:hypothetical protein